MKQILLILALLCTLPIFAQDYSDYLSSAKKHLQAGDKEKAISCYNVYKSMTGQIMEAIICVQKMDVYCKIHGELQMTHVVDKLDLD